MALVNHKKHGQSSCRPLDSVNLAWFMFEMFSDYTRGFQVYLYGLLQFNNNYSESTSWAKRRLCSGIYEIR